MHGGKTRDNRIIESKHALEGTLDIIQLSAVGRVATH